MRISKISKSYPSGLTPAPLLGQCPNFGTFYFFMVCLISFRLSQICWLISTIARICIIDFLLCSLTFYCVYFSTWELVTTWRIMMHQDSTRCNRTHPGATGPNQMQQVLTRCNSTKPDRTVPTDLFKYSWCFCRINEVFVLNCIPLCKGKLLS